MRRARGYLLVAGLVFSISVGAPVALSHVDTPAAITAQSVFVDAAAAQQVSTAQILAEVNDNDGGFETIHDVGNARTDASSSVILNEIRSGDAIEPDVNVDARGGTDPVLVIAGSFRDTGENVFPSGGSARAGTTGGIGIINDSGGVGGDRGDGTSRDSNDSNG